jgi:hypothetical protein
MGTEGASRADRAGGRATLIQAKGRQMMLPAARGAYCRGVCCNHFRVLMQCKWPRPGEITTSTFRRSVLLMIVQFVIVTHAVEEYVRVQLYLPLIDY